MDVERNFVLEIVDDNILDQCNDDQKFIIDNDEKAEWALRKIAEERAETERYINVCRSMIIEYEEKALKADEKLKNKLSYFEGQLQKYFESVIRKETKTQETYTLPSGVLRLKHQQPEFNRDDEILLMWLKENGMNDLIRTDEKPNWAELKKKVNVSGDKVISEDGQIVDGVKVIVKPSVFEIEI